MSVGLRAGYNNTNKRSESFSEALGAAGHSIHTIGRVSGVSADTDLYVQTGFNATSSLRSAIDQKIPYIIMEAPVFRSFDLETHSSWGYNGLQGGAWRPPAPSAERPSPDLIPRHGGGQLIIGQKPTDHSLRGSDHAEWIHSKRLALPEADFRPHPLMVPNGSLVPIEEALRDYGEVFTYSSTVGVDAVLAGCKAHADSEQSLLQHYTGCRESFTHELSWWQAEHDSYGPLVDYILSGYEEARDRIRRGLYETPRGKVDGQAVTARYYQHILC